jgi:sodium/hydrogen antiporter
MPILFLFSVTLILAMLLSALAHRSILSSAVIFLVAGYLGAQLGLLNLGSGGQPVRSLADLALFSVLFTDGMRACVRDITSAWRLPGRALLFGLPLTLLGTALVARYVAGLPWIEALLLGAILSPTDPVLAEAIVGRPEIPSSLRHLLNVESGLNDGLALPFVLTFLACIGAHNEGPARMAGELVLGLALGIVIPWLAGKLEHSRFFAIAEGAEALFAFGIALLVLSTASITHANEYLAGFVGGVTMATVRPDLRDAFERFGRHVTELLKLGALLVFGALVSHEVLLKVSTAGYRLRAPEF